MPLWGQCPRAQCAWFSHASLVNGTLAIFFPNMWTPCSPLITYNRQWRRSTSTCTPSQASSSGHWHRYLKVVLFVVSIMLPSGIDATQPGFLPLENASHSCCTTPHMSGVLERFFTDYWTSLDKWPIVHACGYPYPIMDILSLSKT